MNLLFLVRVSHQVYIYSTIYKFIPHYSFDFLQNWKFDTYLTVPFYPISHYVYIYTKPVH